MAARIAVIAHRGAHEQKPQNSLEAYQAAIDLGCDYIETDLRTDTNGQLVIKHDPVTPGETLPLFEQVLALCKGKIKIYLDIKAAMPSAIVGEVERAGMRDSVISYGSLMLLKDLVRLRSGWPTLPEALTVDTLRAALKELKPKAVALSHHLDSKVIELARKERMEILADRLGQNDNPKGWQEALDAGVTGIQTDKPTVLLAYLRERNLHA